MNRRRRSGQIPSMVVIALLTCLLIPIAGIAAGEGTGDPRVDINRADSVQLAALPGIGDAKANAIVAFRSEHGPFPNIESLMEVPGIGLKLVEKIQPFVKAGD